MSKRSVKIIAAIGLFLLAFVLFVIRWHYIHADHIYVEDSGSSETLPINNDERAETSSESYALSTMTLNQLHASLAMASDPDDRNRISFYLNRRIDLLEQQARNGSKDAEQVLRSYYARYPDALSATSSSHADESR